MDNSAKDILKKAVIFGIGTTFIINLFSGYFFPAIFQKLTNLQYDWYVRQQIDAQNQGATPEDIVIVDIDELTLDRIGRLRPISRNDYADVIDYLATAGANTIGLGIHFRETDTTEVENDILIAALHNAGNVTLALPLTSAQPFAYVPGATNAPHRFHAALFSFSFEPEKAASLPLTDCLNGNFYDLYNNARQLGFMNFSPDRDGSIRKAMTFVTFAGRQYPCFALAILLQLAEATEDQIHFRPGKNIMLPFENRQLTIPIDTHGKLRIKYLGNAYTFRHISFFDVLHKRFPKSLFENKIVLIGSSAESFHDLRQTPVQNSFSGIEIHATILHNLLTGSFIQTVPGILRQLIWLLLLSGCYFVYLRFRRVIALLIGLGLIIVLLIGSKIAFINTSLFCEIISPISGILIAAPVVLIYQRFSRRQAFKRLTAAFSDQVATDLQQKMALQPDNFIAPQSQTDATVVHLEIADFLSFADNKTPDEQIRFLNDFVNTIVQEIVEYNGYIYRNNGHQLTALWGVPRKLSDHGEQACICILNLREKLELLDQYWRTRGWPRLTVRFGISSGVVSGAFFSNSTYIVTGESVELATRLMIANKMYGSAIILCERTYQRIQHTLWVRELDLVRLRRKTGAIRIFELLGYKTENIDPVLVSALEYYIQGLEYYRQQQWIEAFNLFQKTLTITPNDTAAQEFIRRCKIFIEHSRPGGWDGVFDLRQK